MGLGSTVEKLDKYFKRLEQGKAQKIKPSHVDKAIKKLESKEKSLKAEIADTEKASKVERLERKLEMVREQQERARWLKDKIGSS